MTIFSKQANKLKKDQKDILNTLLGHSTPKKETGEALPKRGISAKNNAPINGITPFERVNTSTDKAATRINYINLFTGSQPLFKAKNGPFNSAYESLHRLRFDTPQPAFERDSAGVWVPVRDSKGNQKTAKYKAPKGSKKYPYLFGLAVFFPQLFNAAQSGITPPDPMERLLITEGEFKAFISCMFDIPTVGISGIHMATDKKTNKYGRTVGANFIPALEQFLKFFGVKEIVFLHDADALDNYSNTSRAAQFLASIEKMFFACKSLKIDLFYAYGLSAKNKGIDDQINSGASDDEKALIAKEIKSELFDNSENFKGQYFEFFKVTKRSLKNRIRPLFANSSARFDLQKTILTIKQYLGADAAAVDAITKQIETGEDFAIDAPTGIGKNWLLYYLIKLLPHKKFFFVYPTNLANEAQKNEAKTAHGLDILKVDQTTDKQDIQIKILEADGVNICLQSYDYIDGMPTADDIIIIDEAHKIPISWSIAPRRQLSKLLNCEAQKIYVSGTHSPAMLHTLNTKVLSFEREVNANIRIKCIELKDERKDAKTLKNKQKQIANYEKAILKLEKEAQKKQVSYSMQQAQKLLKEAKATFRRAISEADKVEAKRLIKAAKKVVEQAKKAKSIQYYQKELDKLNKAKSEATKSKSIQRLNKQIKEIQRKAKSLTITSKYLQLIATIAAKRGKVEALEYQISKGFGFSISDKTKLYELAAKNLVNTIDKSAPAKLHFLFINNKKSIDKLVKYFQSKGFDSEGVYSEQAVKTGELWAQLSGEGSPEKKQAILNELIELEADQSGEARQLPLFDSPKVVNSLTKAQSVNSLTTPPPPLDQSGPARQISLGDKHKIIILTSVAYESININDKDIDTVAIFGECWTENVRQALARFRKMQRLDVLYFLASDASKKECFADFKKHRQRWRADFETAMSKLENFNKVQVYFKDDDKQRAKLICDVAYTIDKHSGEFDALGCAAAFDIERTFKMNNKQRFSKLGEYFPTDIYSIDISKVYSISGEASPEMVEQLEAAAQVEADNIEVEKEAEKEAEKINKEKIKGFFKDNLLFCFAYLLYHSKAKFDENLRQQLSELIGINFNKEGESFLKFVEVIDELDRSGRQTFKDYTKKILRLVRAGFSPNDDAINIVFSSAKYKRLKLQLDMLERHGINSFNDISADIADAADFLNIENAQKIDSIIQKILAKRKSEAAERIRKADNKKDAKAAKKAAKNANRFTRPELVQIGRDALADYLRPFKDGEIISLIQSLYLHSESRTKNDRFTIIWGGVSYDDISEFYGLKRGEASPHSLQIAA